jgi:hypothetical protein
MSLMPGRVAPLLLAAAILSLGGIPQDARPELRAGEGVADVTPPGGTELAGFHRAPGRERRSTGVRQPASARALVLSTRGGDFAVISIDVCCVSREFTGAVQAEVARKCGLRPENVRVCATHTHSMPTLRRLRQWGGLPEEYARTVSERAVEAVEAARKDLAPAEFRLGKERVAGGNFNRTTKRWKTDDLFGKDSTTADRWLDTLLQALVFVRGEGRRTLLWYQFSAHPVCFTDGLAGPDWPGLVAESLRTTDGLSPSFLQGHCGDVNPGSGDPWLGDPKKTAEAVSAALRRALASARPVRVDAVRQVAGEFAVPLDLEKERELLERYRADPSKCAAGEWVDAGFAKEWSEVAAKWDPARTSYATPMTALRLGDVAILFHSGELFSYYGLALRRDSPFADTVLVGYADDIIGYVPDPRAYETGEYAATVVPKILDLPRFKPGVGRAFEEAALGLLRRLAE